MTTFASRAMSIAIRTMVFCMLVYTADATSAAVRQWDGGGSDDNWSRPANWVGDEAPSPGDALVFPGGALRGTNVNDYAAGTSFHSLTFMDGNYRITGSPVALLQGIQVSGAAQVNYFLATALLASQTFSNGGSGFLTIGGPLTGSAGLFVLAGTGDIVVSGTINGGLSLEKRGTNTATLLAHNTYTGRSVIREGILIIAHGEGLGPADGENVVVAPMGILRLSGGVAFNKPLMSLQGALQASGGTNLIESYVFLDSSNITVRVEANTELALAGALDGASEGFLTKSGPGRLTLSGSDANFYEATTLVEEGELRLSKPLGTVAIPSRLVIGDGEGGTGSDVVRLMTSSQISDAATIEIKSSGLLDLNNNVDAIGPMELEGGNVSTTAGILILRGDVIVRPSTNVAVLQGNVTLTQGATRRFTVADGASGSDLIIQARMDSSGGTGLTKDGPGRMQLLANNLYVGNTALQAGELVIDGSQTVSTTVVSGGTLGGQGNLGAINATGGRIAPGIAAGLLRCRNVSWSSPATLVCEINGTNAVTDYDQVRVTGTVNLQSAQLELALGLNPPLGAKFLLIDNDGTDAVVGNFQGLPAGSIVLTNEAAFRITYQGGTGNDVELTRVVPPPRILSIGFSGNRQFSISGTGLAHRSYALEISTNLVSWSELLIQQTGAQGTFNFVDPMSATLPLRFYRISDRGMVMAW